MDILHIPFRRRIECGRRNGAGDPMEDRFSSLRCREVINICDGCRLGCVSDVVIDLKCGRVAALVVPVPCRLFGLLGRRDDYVIPWEQVRRVGADIILIESELDKTRCPRRKREFF